MKFSAMNESLSDLDAEFNTIKRLMSFLKSFKTEERYEEIEGKVMNMLQEIEDTLEDA